MLYLLTSQFEILKLGSNVNMLKLSPTSLWWPRCGQSGEKRGDFHQLHKIRVIDQFFEHSAAILMTHSGNARFSKKYFEIVIGKW